MIAANQIQIFSFEVTYTGMGLFLLHRALMPKVPKTEAKEKETGKERKIARIISTNFSNDALLFHFLYSQVKINFHRFSSSMYSK